LLNIDSKISLLSVWCYFLWSLDRNSEVMCVYTINVNNNKMVFSADSLVLVELLTKKGYCSKKVYCGISLQAMDTTCRD